MRVTKGIDARGRRDHRPAPNHYPDPVFCTVCGEELKRVWDPRGSNEYWRHLRRDDAS